MWANNTQVGNNLPNWSEKICWFYIILLQDVFEFYDAMGPKLVTSTDFENYMVTLAKIKVAIVKKIMLQTF